MHSLLTLREKEIFHLLALSFSTKDIANKLCISEKTVRNHISNVICKLGVESRLQALLELVKLGEIDL
ncbi:MAG: LuxR C-terminal-related transcriptional regulator [Erysipelotrichaceae bacterium]|nr:LuxR C-terminal-related transcriptional regulator [Erysipelotrichaceae bacterium]